MREFRIQLGKVLIAFSLVILFLGFSLSIDVNKYQSNPIISNQDNEIPDTTIDNSNDISIDNSSGVVIIPPGDNPNNVVVTPPNTENKETVPDNTVTIESYNNALRNTIQNSYGVTIKYGTETDGYKVGGLSVVSDYDQWVIREALLELQANMALYPNNFYSEIRNGGLPLTILLIKNYSSMNVTGITEKNRTGVIISIALDYPFSDSFNHEMYHYIEHYIYTKDGGYPNWNSYNPSGFVYSHFDPMLVYNLTFSEDSYFVNTYAQSYEYEDRASTFEYLMADDKISPLNQGKNIWKKAKLICETIDYYFTSVNDATTEYWERFIY